MRKERLSCLIISYFNKFTFKQEKILLEKFKSYTNFINSNSINFKLPILFYNKIIEFNIFKKQFNLEKELEYLNKESIKFVCSFEINYPKNLKEIYNPPLVLFYKGELKNTKYNCLAIIGSRKYSYYGFSVTNFLIKDLNNLCIVSGLAVGIDTLAHNNALKYNLKTIAVLGSGLDNESIYPKENKELLNNIIQNNGLIISEFSPKTKALKNNFRLRNRIISGLSRAVLIIEGKDKSGTKITANYALEQNRDIFAVPGNIFSQNSYTCNKLISQGAILIQNAKDINDFFQS